MLIEYDDGVVRIVHLQGSIQGPNFPRDLDGDDAFVRKPGRTIALAASTTGSRRLRELLSTPLPRRCTSAIPRESSCSATAGASSSGAVGGGLASPTHS